MDPKNLKIYRLHMRRHSDIGFKAISDSQAVRLHEEDIESKIDISPRFLEMLTASFIAKHMHVI